jgi:rubredoxin
MENKKQYCECPLCDNASEAGCMNEATILVPQSESCGSDYWLCPNCAGSVAVVSKIETGRALSFEQLAELDKAEKA